MKKIFTPIQVGPMRLKNRIVAAPSVTYNASPFGEVSERQVDMYRERAIGGFGFIHVEASTIRDDGKAFPCFLAVDHPKFLPGLSKIVEVCHIHGAKVGIQLIHTGRNAQKEFIDAPPVAPSDKMIWRDKPHVLTTAECDEMIELYARSAGLAKSVGFDAVCFHGSLGHLPAQFLSPLTNDRTDKYGERTRFVVDMIKACRDAVGNDVALIYRGSVDEGVEGGLTIDDWVTIAPVLEEAGIDCIDVYPGIFESVVLSTLPLYMPEAYYVPFAERIKQVVNVPVMVVGKLMNQRIAERVIEDGKADLVSYTRPKFADTHFPRKMMEGRYEDIRKCICCDRCVGDGFSGRMAECSINPSFQREKEFAITQPAPKRRKLLVAGGGVAGMEAARVAAKRGHEVVLFEKTDKLGGLITHVSTMPFLYMRELNYIVEWHQVQLKKLGVDIRLEQAVTADIIEAEQPDVIFIATGSREVPPPIAADEQRSNPNVLTLIEGYLKKDKKTKLRLVGDRVVVIGGTYGTELAISIAREKPIAEDREKKQVTLLDESPQYALASYISLTVTREIALRTYLKEDGVTVRQGVRVDAIVDGGVRIINEDGKTETLEADTVIWALPRVSERSLSKEVRERFGTNDNMRSSGEWGHYVGLRLEVAGKPCELYELGDCIEPRTLKEAIHAAAYFARMV